MSQQHHPDIRPPQIEEHLGGINYPIQKQDLKQQAQKANATYYVVEIIDQMPDREYESATDVDRGIDATQ